MYGIPTGKHIPKKTHILLKAEPEPLEIELQKTAIIVVDMQNAYVSKDGMLDLIGLDASNQQKIIEPIKKITEIARGKKLKIIFTAFCYSADLRESGGPTSPNWHKDIGVRLYREHPEWQDKLLFRGTWGAEIIEQLKPQEGDILVEKSRPSAFFGTNLDTILKTYSIEYLVFVGTATNICVEASLRDAYCLDYWPIIISDAVAPVPVASPNPLFMQDATIFNVKLVYGWVTTIRNFIKAMTT